VLYSMIRMVNDRRIMGEYVNNKFQNIVGWTTTISMIALTILLIFTSVRDWLHT